MTAHIVQLFPDRLTPHEPDRDLHVARARAVLRSAHPQDPATLRDACRVLQAWGEPMDWMEADAMMLALSLHNRPPRPTVTDYRAEFAPVLWFFGVAALFLTVFFAVTP